MRLRHVTFALFTFLSSVLALRLSEVIDVFMRAQSRRMVYETKTSSRKTYDFIVVGASPSGCVIANRLTEDRNQQVLLLEAGIPDSPVTDIPALNPYLVLTDYNWDFTAEPNPGACWGMEDGVCPWPAGKGTGGGTIVNAMIWTRGNFRDFDSWAREGNPGWSYEELLPLFVRNENVLVKQFRNSKYRGKSGNLSVDFPPYTTPLFNAFLKAGKSFGYRIVDYNNPNSHIGYAQIQATIKGGRRVSAATAFIRPILGRKNLYINLNSRATRIIIDPVSRKALGIEYNRNGKTETVFAKKEVIVAAGAFNSPQLLMLSGIGPAYHLTEMGIPVLVDLPVGENLQEHIGMHGLSFVIDKPVSINPFRIFDSALVGGIEYLALRRGPLTSLGCEGVAYAKTKYSNSSEDYPDLELLFVGSGMNTDKGILLRRAFGISDEVYDSVYREYDGLDAFGIWPMVLYPESRGLVRLRNKNPLSKVRIYNNFLQVQRDIEILVEGLKMAVELAKTPPFQAFGARLIDNPFPQCRHLQFGSDKYWECTVRTMTCQWHHQCGTCKMGTVVDSRLRVFGVTNLRVADASVMPTITGGHTQAPAYVIGEKAADLIREDWNIPF
ncbi:glucose dehydrogenase [FAD, quinone] [Halyomorpha halys]|uniref:glucose dehydrogenase [FAD, quinone] n=1 Tax=Halyomorpha halys TaxID=286706 RepID=UPI0006D51B28|nr:glucose dehydrogenase [FAD, quinone]-like [Halyomorpha halys]